MNLLMEKDLKEICRLCHLIGNDYVHFSDIVDDNLVSESVKLICGIKFNVDDRFSETDGDKAHLRLQSPRLEGALSTKICIECYEVINDAMKLRKKAAKNEVWLRCLLLKRENIEGEYLDEAELDEEFIEELPAQNVDVLVIEKLPNSNLQCKDVQKPAIKQHQPSKKSLNERPKCEFCGKSFVNISSLSFHTRKVHNKSLEFSCDICGKKTKTKKKIEIHIRSHKFTFESEMIHNFSDFFEAIPRPRGFRCTFCPFNDNDLSVVLDHLNEHEDFIGADGGYCSLCPKVMTSMDFMIEHTKEHNKMIKTQRCLICSREYAMDEKFLKHLEEHKRNENEMCECEICGKRFTRRSRMETHIASVHEKKTLYNCHLCGIKLGSSTSLSNHLKRHDQKDKFPCPFCPKKFSCRALLNSHKIIHSNDQPFGCHLCEKKFKRPETLKDHLRRHAGTLKRIPCEICSMTLQSKYALSRHMLTHTGSKPHQCEYCQKAYAQKNDLVKHLRTHIGENTYNCDFPGCNEAFRIIADLRVHQGVHYAKRK